MAVTMLIGNATRIPNSLFSLGNTLASVIASQFNEAASDVHRSAMMGLALLLFLITLMIGLVWQNTHETRNKSLWKII